MFEIVLLVQAEDEMDDAYNWYEEQQPALGNKFYNEVSYCLNLLETNPYLFPIKYVDELRGAPLNKFPFQIVFWVDVVQSTIYVASIFHNSRNPKY